MKSKRQMRRALFLSCVSIFMCFVMLLGTTYAWFTDSVNSGINLIVAGNLDVKLYHENDNTTGKEEVLDDTELFTDVDSEKWEPGAMAWEKFTVENAGELALKYKFALNAFDASSVIGADGNEISFTEMLKVAVVSDTFSYTRDAVKEISAGDWKNLDELEAIIDNNGLDKGASKTFGIIIWWQPSDMDNLFNMNNGKTTGSVSVKVGVVLNATQAPFEEDSFDENYDDYNPFPTIPNTNQSTSIDGVVQNNLLTTAVDIGDATSGKPTANLPADVEVEDGATQLTLNVNPTSPVYNIQMTDGQAQKVLNVKIEGVSKNNTTPMTVNLGPVLPTGLKVTSIQLYHIENDIPVLMTYVDTFTAHNQFTYDKDTGAVSIYVANFSEFVFISEPSNPWDGTEDETWKAEVIANYDTTINFEIDSPEKLAALGALVAEGYDFKDKTVMITKSLDLGGHAAAPKTFYPIGYKYNENATSDEIHPFRGTLDALKDSQTGRCYRIFHLSQSTWAIKGHYDKGYYNESLGLFAWLDGATVQNIIFEHFEIEGEFAPIGCIAGIATGGTFENIKLFRNDIATYNTGIGSLIGWDSNNTAPADNAYTYTFKDIEIDDTNYVRALWGSWDVGCGGVMGHLGANSKASMNNVTVAAKLDVFNDVCANYQYYQYRYSGMIIGSIGRGSVPVSANLVCENVKVYLGDWTDYYYCEFVKNSQASYTEDFQFSRVDEKDIVFDLQGNPVSCTHKHDDEREDRLAYHLPFSQLYTGYGWGASPVFAHEGVTVSKYAYTITYFDGVHTVGADYILDNKNAFTDLKEIVVSSEYQGHTYEWVNVNGETVTSIPAGTDRNVMLYVNTTDKNMVRFVDKDGFVIYEADFTPGKDNYSDEITEPAVPAVSGYIGVWPDYVVWLKAAANGQDVVVHPVYSVDENFDRTDILDDITDINVFFRKITEGHALTMYKDLEGSMSSANTKIFSTVVGDPAVTGDTESRFDLDSFTLKMTSTANGNQDWTLFKIKSGHKLTVGAGLSGSGTVTFDFVNLHQSSDPCIFHLEKGATLVLERGVTIQVLMPKGHGAKLEVDAVIKGHDHSLSNDPNHTEDDGAETTHSGLHIIIDTESDPKHDIVKIVVTGTTTLVGNVNAN